MSFDMYGFSERTKALYGLLRDGLSRKVFWARLSADICPSVQNLVRLSRLCRNTTPEEAARKERLAENLRTRIGDGNSPIVIYGTGMTGRQIATGFMLENIPFYGFCCRNSERYAGGMMGKPVISADRLCAEPERYYVVVAAQDVAGILRVLREHRFPEERILSIFDGGNDPTQYFEFPELFRDGTAFVDGGCCDGDSSLRFADWCGGAYSRIVAFEPDSACYMWSRKNMEARGLRNYDLLQAGLSDHTDTVELVNKGDGRSFITNAKVWMRPPEVKAQETVQVRTVVLDDVIRDLTVGFIKLDIEGAEMNALRGAERTITRDRPLLAVCVYHQPGDMLAIMDYLHTIVPEYGFWLRHYSCTTCETVLYAAVKKEKAL